LTAVNLVARAAEPLLEDPAQAVLVIGDQDTAIIVLWGGKMLAQRLASSRKRSSRDREKTGNPVRRPGSLAIGSPP